MVLTSEVDQLLTPLGAPFRRQADALLDFRECALGRAQPGRCVACYFRLRETAADALLNHLCPLRRWLEEHIEIVACDERERTLESLPLHLTEATGLAEYCHAIMDEFRDNRAYPAESINLEFRFRPDSARAA